MPQSAATWRPSGQVIDQLIGLALQAGHIALHYFTYTTPHLKIDQTLVTQADVEIEQFLAEQIKSTFPDHSLIAEEGQWGAIDPARPIWALDPLDGTTAFVHGLPGWGISIGALHRGQPCFGLFYMPLLNDLTYTTQRGEVYGNGRNLRRAVRREWGAKGFLAVGSSTYRSFELDVPRIRTLGSAGASLIYTARGAAAGALIPKARVWDIVAGAAILERAGGRLHYLSGQPIDYEHLLDGRLAPEPILAGHPAMLAELQGAIRPLNRKPET